jgi:signal transduction histidine kinase
MITIEGLPTIYARLAEIYRGMTSGHEFHHVEYKERNTDSLQTYIHWQGPAGTYSTLPSQMVAERRVPMGTFTGKIVLIGSKLESRKAFDYILSPFSRVPQSMSKLEGAANSLVTLMRDDGIRKSPCWMNWILSLFVGLLTLNMVLHLPPGRGIFFVAGEVAILVGLGWGLLFGADFWLDLAHPLIVACVGYYLVIPYRLVDEYRKRWHYQEKSELMTQLEQLKSNFLSLVSHDLKTPIARIQGNAELIQNTSGNLSEDQKMRIAAIVQTTEDLSRYVETVLDLTRIESSRVPVNKITKDINATIMEVVEEKRFLAAEKNIQIVVELEPLFSIKFDVKLMRRVLSNLVENAIKYSPPNSHITLRSREEGNWVRVLVADEGIGIAPEEQQKVFAKFYRGRNATSRDIKGTGLGLYLVKYFVELHKGMVELKSELGKGSTFTVSLPV